MSAGSRTSSRYRAVTEEELRTRVVHAVDLTFIRRSDLVIIGHRGGEVVERTIPHMNFVVDEMEQIAAVTDRIITTPAAPPGWGRKRPREEEDEKEDEEEDEEEIQDEDEDATCSPSPVPAPPVVHSRPQTIPPHIMREVEKLFAHTIICFEHCDTPGIVKYLGRAVQIMTEICEKCG